MNNIDIQALARQAGIVLYPEFPQGEEQVRLLERFAALYREALFAELRAGSGEPVDWRAILRNGYKDDEGKNFVCLTNGDAWEMAEIIKPIIADHLAAAVLRERESNADKCRSLAESYKRLSESDLLTEAGKQVHSGMYGGAMNCEAAIRKGEQE